MPHRDAEFSKFTLQLHQQYIRLVQIIDSMGQDSVSSIEPIAEHMKRIKQTEADLLPLRNEFLRSGRKLSDELQAATDETIELVKGLMPKLAQLEKATLESAKRLFPQVQESVRAVQMQNAYGASSRS